MVEYRALPDSALDRYRAYLAYAFNPTGDRFDPEDAEELPPPATVGDRRGLFDGEELVSVCAHYDFDTRVRGRRLSMGGISAVATPPEYRRHGHVATLLRESLEEYREADHDLAALWAFSHPFYRQYGWAIANRYARQEGPPGALGFAREEATGAVFEAEPDDWEALNAVVDEHGASYELTIDRTQEWWEKRVFHGWQSDPYVYAWSGDDGVGGYLVYMIEETSDGDSRLTVTDMAYTSREARVSLLAFLANHEGQIDIVRIRTPPDALVLDEIEDPNDFEYTVRPGPMVRLVDVRSALEGIEYPTEVEGSARVHVEDAEASWNDGTFEISISGGEASVEEIDAEPAVTLPIGALSQLFVGYRSLGELKRSSDAVDLHAEGGAELVADAFPGRSVFLREHF